MRLQAYKNAIDQAQGIMNIIPELSNYFNHIYSPKDKAIEYILQMARKDEKLFHCEFISLYNEIRKRRDNDI